MGDGAWYAVVEVTRWRQERGRQFGEAVATFHEKCDGRPAAINATRRLLKEHAEAFDKGLTIEASVCTDLEWEDGKP